MLRWGRGGEILLQSKGGQEPQQEPIEPGGEVRVLEGLGEGQADHVAEVRPGGGDEEGLGLLRREASHREQD